MLCLQEICQKQFAETPVHTATHTAVPKMNIVNYWVNVLQHTVYKQFRMNILYRKVKAIENWFYLYEKLAMKRVFRLKSLTIV